MVEDGDIRKSLTQSVGGDVEGNEASFVADRLPAKRMDYHLVHELPKTVPIDPG
jgi:hypothetical protein